MKFRFVLNVFLSIFLTTGHSFGGSKCLDLYQLSAKKSLSRRAEPLNLFSIQRDGAVDIEKWKQLIFKTVNKEGLERLESHLNLNWHSGHSILRKLSDRPLTVTELFEAINRLPIGVDDKDRLDMAVGFKNKKTSQWKWLRPNRDPMPDIIEWEIGDYDQLDDSSFTRLMAEGKMPMSLTIMVSHEIAGHYLPWLINLELMKATRTYYQKLQLGQIRHRPSGYGDVVFEFLSLPDIGKEKEIIRIFGPLKNAELLTPKSVLDSYKSFEQQKHKMELLSELGETLILRVGGAIGKDNYISLDAERPGTTNSRAEIDIIVNEDIFFPKENLNYPGIGRAPRHSVHYAWYQFKELYLKLNLMETSPVSVFTIHPAEISKLKLRLLGRLAALETIFKNALSLEITPEKFVTQAYEPVSTNDTKNFIRSYAPVQSLWRSVIEN